MSSPFSLWNPEFIPRSCTERKVSVNIIKCSLSVYHFTLKSVQRINEQHFINYNYVINQWTVYCVNESKFVGTKNLVI